MVTQEGDRYHWEHAVLWWIRLELVSLRWRVLLLYHSFVLYAYTPSNLICDSYFSLWHILVQIITYKFSNGNVVAQLRYKTQLLCVLIILVFFEPRISWRSTISLNPVQLTGLVPNVQVFQSFSARTVRSIRTEKYPSKHVNCSLSRSFSADFSWRGNDRHAGMDGHIFWPKCRPRLKRITGMPFLGKHMVKLEVSRL